MKRKIVQCIVCIGMLLTTFSTIGIPSVCAYPPAEPSDPLPADGSSGVTIFIKLQWICNESGFTYDVYLGVQNPPPLIVANHSTTSYRPTTRLLLNTTYYWQIVVYNNEQETNQSPVWSFTTAGDSPPFPPTILKGPTVAGSKIELEFITVAPDPEGDQVSYQWDWGDGNISEWLGPYAFGEQVKTTHLWADNGTYDIRVRAKDVLGEESSWSSAYQITISPQIQFVNMRPGYLYFVIFEVFDKTYGYVHSLDELDLALIITTGGMTVNATASDAVHTVIFEMEGRFLDTARWNTTGVAMSGNYFEGAFVLENGLYIATATAYDENGCVIDRVVRPYVAYYTWQFNIIKQILGRG